MGERLEGIPGFSIDEVAAAAGSDPEMLRMENLDTDIPPPAAAVEATRAAVGTDEAISWLPFTGMGELKHEVARMIVRRGGPRYDPEGEVVITSGEGDNMLDALLALTRARAAARSVWRRPPAGPSGAAATARPRSTRPPMASRRSVRPDSSSPRTHRPRRSPATAQPRETAAGPPGTRQRPPGTRTRPHRADAHPRRHRCRE